MYVIKIFINKTARKIQKDVIQYIIYQTKPKTITPETFKNIDRKIFMESQKKNPDDCILKTYRRLLK